MKKINQSPKQPDVLRERLLAKASEIIQEKGLANLTLDAVAKAAEVSKGGLLHHFPNKQSLIEAVFLAVMQRYEDRIGKLAASDSLPTGKFTRAYIRLVTKIEDDSDGPLLGLFTMAMATEPRLQETWTKWVENQETIYGETPPSIGCCIARVAADGLLLASLSKSMSIPTTLRQSVIEKLFEMTEE